ncbi:MAG TPA: alpha/beta hydrolase [Tepidisphaeraceae bacterium]|jgi:fermentation-respiration switch protein FrsA (DUF1100 family)
MIASLHQLIVAIYLGVPIAAVLLSFFRPPLFRARVAAALFLGLIISLVLNFASAFMDGGHVKASQVGITAYLAASLLLILKTFDLLLCNALAHLFFPMHKRPGWLRRQLAFFARVVVLFAAGLPYILAAGLTYRTKNAPTRDPISVLQANYQLVNFTTSDGKQLAAWWIPSSRPHAFYANQTILLCPGYGGDKSTDLNLARPFVDECYNVLIIDFRGRGDSQGQFSTFGDLERRDVLAAVHWLRTEHAVQTSRIYGIGESTGAAALIAAAADRGEDGQAIAAIVAYTPFARLDDLATAMTGQVFSIPAKALVRVGLPMASAQTGADLTHFAPMNLVRQLWPRPILIIHSQSDELIPWEQGDALYQAASYPKDYEWLDNQTHRQTMQDRDVARHVLWFIQHAQPVRVI